MVFLVAAVRFYSGGSTFAHVFLDPYVLLLHILALNAPIATAADDKYFATSFTIFEKISYDIS